MHAVSDPSRSAVSRSTNEFLLEDGTAPIPIYLFGGVTLFKQGAPINSRGGARTEGLLLSLALAERRGVAREQLLAQV